MKQRITTLFIPLCMFLTTLHAQNRTSNSDLIKKYKEQLLNNWGFEYREVYSAGLAGFPQIAYVNPMAVEAKDNLLNLASSGTLTDAQMKEVLDALTVGLATPIAWDDQSHIGRVEVTIQFRKSILERLGSLLISSASLSQENKAKILDLMIGPLTDETPSRRSHIDEDGNKHVTYSFHVEQVLKKEFPKIIYFSPEPLREVARKTIEEALQAGVTFSEENLNPTIQHLKNVKNEHDLALLSWWNYFFQSNKEQTEHTVQSKFYANLIVDLEKIKEEGSQRVSSPTASTTLTPETKDLYR